MFKKSGDYKGSASESLTCYPAMRAFVEDLRDRRGNLGAFAPAAASFLAICHVLDLLSFSSSGQLQPAALQTAIVDHMVKFKAAYGKDKVQPKGHFNLHLPKMLEQHGLLLSCFVHERRHKELKRYANQLSSMQAGSEDSVMESALKHHLEQLECYQVQRRGLEKPRPAHHELQAFVCEHLGLLAAPGMLTSAVAFVGTGKMCKRGDVVLLSLPEGRCVAQVWFHVSHMQNAWSCVSVWAKSAGRNKFITNKETRFVPTDAISGVCIHRPEDGNDQLCLVCPLRSLF